MTVAIITVYYFQYHPALLQSTLKDKRILNTSKDNEHIKGYIKGYHNTSKEYFKAYNCSYNELTGSNLRHTFPTKRVISLQ